ncbi:DUF4156 domain-containing protein [Halomonas sp. DP5Y7-2]|nr:DUF4156 domain-containing protein [Halomonas denitrificans]MBY5984753.1 DUF4156 domain-containing protein [Halomonas sp. DP5Y7-2]
MSESATFVKAADERRVTGCKFIGEVQGSSGWGNIAASRGMDNARNEAQEEAAKLGATHIVWMNISGGYSPFAIGRAYDCSGSESPSVRPSSTQQQGDGTLSTSAYEGSVTSRLQKLDMLREQDIVSEEEYNLQRRRILDDI